LVTISILEMAVHVDGTRERLDHLDRSVLAKAFRGELVETEAERAPGRSRLRDGWETTGASPRRKCRQQVRRAAGDEDAHGAERAT
jgi:hypothetical protein